MQRAAVSVPSNIAEGFRRNSKKELSHFLSIALGSVGELETQLILSNDLYAIEVADALEESEEIQRMMIGFRKTLQ